MIYTFYSYKGGVGRTMALANVAELLYRAGLKVLMIDWDLEAPGLERFFCPDDLERILDKRGIIDLILKYKMQMTKKIQLQKEQELPFEKPKDIMIDIYPESTHGKLYFINAGRRSKGNISEYANAVLTFDWKDFYENWQGEAYIEWLRKEFEKVADVILIDSRTGVTEMGGVCTYHLADVVVLFCAANDQNIQGTIEMVKNFSNPKLIELRHDRQLRTLVVPARIEKTAETTALNQFRKKCDIFIKPLSDDLKKNVELLKELEIPYVPLYAFDEIIAVKQEDKSKRYSDELTKAYTKLTQVIASFAPQGSVIQQNIKSAILIRDWYSQTVPSLDPIALRNAYLNRLLLITGSLYLSGIDRKAVGYEDESCLSIESVYTALLTRSVDKERILRSNRELEEGSLSALTLLNRYDRLVLLGDHGSGKSTFVNFVAICLSGENLNQTGAYLERLTCPLPDDEGMDREERQPWSHGALLPVRIVLRDFAARGLPDSLKETTAEDLWQFIESELNKGMLSEFSLYLRQELMEQGGIILLDGLDEVPEADSRREQIKSAVEDFAKTFDRCRILVTSRTYAYQKQNWRLTGFAEAELAPFSSGQIRRFIDQWYSHIASVHRYDKEDAQGRAELLKRAIFGIKERLSWLIVYIHRKNQKKL